MMEGVGRSREGVVRGGGEGETRESEETKGREKISEDRRDIGD